MEEIDHCKTAGRIQIAQRNQVQVGIFYWATVLLLYNNNKQIFWAK